MFINHRKFVGKNSLAVSIMTDYSLVDSSKSTRDERFLILKYTNCITSGCKCTCR